MTTTTVSSREFNQDRARVKKATENGPVVVTDRGKPVLVLLTYKAYEELQPQHESVADALYMPGADEIDLPLPERTPYVPREIDW